VDIILMTSCSCGWAWNFDFYMLLPFINAHSTLSIIIFWTSLFLSVFPSHTLHNL
jgi:hypothetical protein